MPHAQLAWRTPEPGPSQHHVRPPVNVTATHRPTVGNVTTRELRVLHIITRLIIGGAQENTLNTVIGQTATPGMSVTLACGYDAGSPEGTLEDRAREAGIDLQHIPQLVRPIAPFRDAAAFAGLVR